MKNTYTNTEEYENELEYERQMDEESDALLGYYYLESCADDDYFFNDMSDFFWF